MHIHIIHILLKNKIVRFKYLFVINIIYFIVCIAVYILPVLISIWQDSWTNFLISPFINIFNLITSIYQIISSTVYFVLDLVTVTFASSIVALKIFGQLFLNVRRIIQHRQHASI